LFDSSHADRDILQPLQLAALDALNERRTQALRHIEVACLNGRGPRRRFDDDAEANTVEVRSAAPIVVIANNFIFLPGDPGLELEGTRAGRWITADHLLLAGRNRLPRCNVQSLRVGKNLR